MALSIIGTPGAGTGATITLPAHAVGDIIVIWAYRDGSTTVPSKPAAAGTVPAWSDIDAAAGANTNSARSAYFVATATNHTSGTWSNATGMAVIVLRGQAASPIGGHAQSGSTSSTLATAPSITQSVTNGKSVILEFYGHRTVTAWSTAPAGYTRRAAVSTETCLNTKDSTTSDGSISQNCTTSGSSGYRGQTIEIIASDSSPTVALNSPADAGSTSDTTPDLAFTGTDADGDTIRYNIQVDPVNTFDSQTGGAPTVTDSYSETNYAVGADVGMTAGGGLESVGQSFTATTDGNISSAKFYFRKDGSITGNVVANLYAHSGTFGTSSVGTGSALATSDNVTDGSISTSNTLVEFTFSGANQVALVAGTHYVIMLNSAGVSGNLLRAGSDNSSPTHSGNFVQRSGAGVFSATSSFDNIFYVYITTGSPLIDKVSGTDTGFTDITDGADTDPFDSGDQIQYTVQSALTPGATYYWRVRGIDPTGTNTYGSWATTRSFSITSGTVNSSFFGLM